MNREKVKEIVDPLDYDLVYYTDSCHFEEV